MECPTFGGVDGAIALRVQSLDRKGDLSRQSDRNKVLISRAPKRHKSITSMNFFATPRGATEAPPPVPKLPLNQLQQRQRPAPRFLEVFEPLMDEMPNCNATATSAMSTPSSRISSLPQTPHSPRLELIAEPKHKEQSSYFAYVTHGHYHDRDLTVVQNQASREKEADATLELDERDWEEECEYPSISERSFCSSEQLASLRRENHSVDIGGTFGRA